MATTVLTQKQDATLAGTTPAATTALVVSAESEPVLSGITPKPTAAFTSTYGTPAAGTMVGTVSTAAVVAIAASIRMSATIVASTPTPTTITANAAIAYAPNLAAVVPLVTGLLVSTATGAPAYRPRVEVQSYAGTVRVTLPD
jgi:hypothetical protein